MTSHPYIGRTFRVLQHPYRGENAGTNDIPAAVCVFIAQAGSTATEDGCGYAAAYMRLPDGTHKEVYLTDLVGPLDEPAPAAPAPTTVPTSDDYRAGALAALDAAAAHVNGYRHNADLHGNDERRMAYSKVLSAITDLREMPWEKP